MKSILIHTKRNGRNMYLTANGILSGNKSDAQEHWAFQFDSVVSEIKSNWPPFYQWFAEAVERTPLSPINHV